MELMMHFGWVGAAILVVLLVGAVVAATYLLRPKAANADTSSRRAIKAVTIVLAFIGILALVAVGAMALMHWGMMGGMMACCS